MAMKPDALFTVDTLGTRWHIERLDEQSWTSSQIAQLTAVMIAFNDNYTRFTDTSYIGQLNLHHQLRRPPQELLDMFRFAQQMHTLSNGVFNISVGGELHKRGYGTRQRTANVIPNFWSQVKYDRDKIVIPSEIVLDLGGFGKGWLIDKLSVLIERYGVKDYSINGGGDLYVTSSKPLTIALERIDGDYSTLQLAQGALAVSGDKKRSWQHDGNHYHHIIDPTTGTSSQNSGLVYVQAKTALIADTIATVLFVNPSLAPALEKRFLAKSYLALNQ